MAVARGDDGSGNVTRRRTLRKPLDAPPGPASPTTTATASPLPPIGRSTGGLRLDDLYRLPMPKLFALCERQSGISAPK